MPPYWAFAFGGCVHRHKPPQVFEGNKRGKLRKLERVVLIPHGPHEGLVQHLFIGPFAEVILKPPCLGEDSLVTCVVKDALKHLIISVPLSKNSAARACNRCCT